MKQRNFTMPALLALALAACQQPADEANIAIDNEVNAANAANPEIESLPPSEEAGTPAPSNSASGLNEADDAGSEDPNLAFIPAQYRDRWGMVAADCTSTRGDTKGLMTIGDTSIRFYESTATLKAQRPSIATSFSGQFDFTGEGQTWTKVMTFTRTGNNLKRADGDGNYSYQRC
ncbi:MAG: hypothetical protein LH465_02775 [Sphingomonas bacterium]|nr:hypothetical protein [Sphingomonas bacterium]